MVDRGTRGKNPWDKATSWFDKNHNLPMTQVFGESMEQLSKAMKGLTEPLNTKVKNSVMNFTKGMDNVVGSLNDWHKKMKVGNTIYATFTDQFKKIGDVILSGLKKFGGMIAEWIKSTQLFQTASSKMANIFNSMGESGKKMRDVFDRIATLTKKTGGALGSLSMDEVAAIIKHQDTLIGLAKFAAGVKKPNAGKVIGGLFGGLGHEGMFGGGAVGGNVSETLKSMAHFAPELSILFTLFEHGQFQEKMANLTRSFGGYGKDFDSVTSSIMMLQAKIPMTSDELVQLTEGFQNVGINVRASNKDFQGVLESSANAIHMMGLSTETTSEWSRAITYAGGSTNDLEKSFAGLYEGVTKNNLGFKAFDAITSESLHLWDQFGGILHETLQDFSKDLTKAAVSFRLLNIDMKAGMEMVQNTLSDPDVRAAQAGMLTALGGGSIESNLKLLSGATAEGQLQLADKILQITDSMNFGEGGMADLQRQKMIQNLGGGGSLNRDIMNKLLLAHQTHPGETMAQIMAQEGAKGAGGANFKSYQDSLASFNTSLGQVMQKFTNTGLSLAVIFGGPIFRLISPLLTLINQGLDSIVVLMQKFPGIMDAIVDSLLLFTGVSMVFRIGALAKEISSFGIALGGIGKVAKVLFPEFLWISSKVGPLLGRLLPLLRPLLTMIGMPGLTAAVEGTAAATGMGAGISAATGWMGLGSASAGAIGSVGAAAGAGGLGVMAMPGVATAAAGGAVLGGPIVWGGLIVAALIGGLVALFPTTAKKLFDVLIKTVGVAFKVLFLPFEMAIKDLTEFWDNTLEGWGVIAHWWDRNVVPTLKSWDAAADKIIGPVINQFSKALNDFVDWVTVNILHEQVQDRSAKGRFIADQARGYTDSGAFVGGSQFGPGSPRWGKYAPAGAMIPEGKAGDIVKTATASLGQSLWSNFAAQTRNGIEGCAASVSNVLQRAGLTKSNALGVNQLGANLAKEGWKKYSLKDALPGDVILTSHHTGIVGANGAAFDNHSSTGKWSQDTVADFAAGKFGGNPYVLRAQAAAVRAANVPFIPPPPPSPSVFTPEQEAQQRAQQHDEMVGVLKDIKGYSAATVNAAHRIANGIEVASRSSGDSRSALGMP